MYRIAVTGPESTGKSVLAKQLAEHYSAEMVPEFARSYLDQIRRPYSLHDLEIIAAGQVSSEDTAAAAGCSMMICDTELTVIKIWAEHCFGNCPVPVEQELMRRSYDLYLLCNIDLPWEYDPLREHPNLREYFFNLYLKELNSRGTNVKIIEGSGSLRLENAIRYVDHLIYAGS